MHKQDDSEGKYLRELIAFLTEFLVLSKFSKQWQPDAYQAAFLQGTK